MHKMLGTCHDDAKIKNARHTPYEASEIKFSSSKYDKPIEYCLVEQPNGDKLHFSLVPDKKNPDVIR